MSITDDLLNFKPEQSTEEKALEETETKRHNAFADLGDALFDYAKGAVQGFQEVKRAGDQVATTDPLALTGLDTISVDTTNRQTPAQQEATDWYKNATDNVADETIKPAAFTAAMLGSGVAVAAISPLIAKDTVEQAQEKGLSEALTEFGKNTAPVYGSYKQTQEEGWDDYANEHPLRAASILVAAEAPFLIPAVHTAKYARKNYLINKAKKKPVEAEQIIKGEFDLQHNKLTAKAEPSAKTQPTISEALLSTEEPTITQRSAFKPKNIQERIDHAVNSEVSKRIDRIVDEGFKQAKQLEDTQPFRGAYEREITPLPTEYPHPVRIHQILETANSITPIRVGHLKAGKNTLGYYMPKQEGIRIRSFQKFDTISHEIGHSLDKKFNIQGHDIELEAAAKSVWKDGQYKDWELRGEGIAEFTAEYVMNPEIAEKNFPGYYKDFTSKLAEDPKLQKKMDTLSNQVRKWYTQSAEARVRGAVVLEGDIKTPIKQQVIKNIDTVKNALVDDTAIFRAAIKDFEEFAGYKLRLEETPADIALAIKSTIPARSQMLLGLSKLDSKYVIGALEEVYNIPLNKVTFADVYAPLEALAKSGKHKEYLSKHGLKDWHEAFTSYMSALHTLEVIDLKNIEKVTELTEQLTDFQQKLKAIDPTLNDKAARKLEKAILKTEKAIAAIVEGRADYVTPIKKSDAVATIKNAPGDLKVAAEQLQLFNENILDLSVMFGFLKKEMAADFKEKYPHYVPLYRDFSLENAMDTSFGKHQNFVDIDKFFKALSEEGSERSLKDPIVSMQQAVMRLINNGERNKVGQALAALAKRDKSASLLMEVKGSSPAGAKGIFTVWENGKQKAYQAIAPGVYEAVKEMDRGTAAAMSNILAKIATTSAKTLRIGATSTPAFTVWNFLRDSVFASLASETGLKPVFGTLEGFFSRADKELMARFEAQGVPFSTYIGNSRDITKRLRRAAGNSPRYKDNLAYKVGDKTISTMLNFNQMVEEAPRLAEFKRALEKGYSPQKAGALARDLTLNFARAGTKGRQLNRYTAFFNATIQGFDKFCRMAYEKPKETLAFGTAYITLPTIALWYQNHDKDWYRDMPFDDKMKYWFFELNDTIFKVPKPELPGYLFGSAVERTLDMIADNDPQALEHNTFNSFLISNTVPNAIPTAILPIIEWIFNYNLYRGKPIVSSRDMKKETPDQYNIYTSEVAKSIGKTTGFLSPAKVDNSIKAVTGSMGIFFLSAYDAFAKENATPDKKLTDLTRFTFTEGSRTRSAEVFYDGLDALEKQYNSSSKKNKSKNYKGMLSAKKQIDAHRKTYNIILNDEKLDGATKRTKLDEINKKINAIQRKANQRYLNYKYIQNPQK
nr:MAG TPA: Large polyvalent protein associated domain 38 [Bacteriophage sp.]